jgi:hypothetical protein
VVILLLALGFLFFVGVTGMEGSSVYDRIVALSYYYYYAQWLRWHSEFVGVDVGACLNVWNQIRCKKQRAQSEIEVEILFFL